VQIAAVAPDIFTANASGGGVAAATAIRVGANGTTANVPVFQCGSGGANCVPVAIALDAGPVYVTLYGTGIRGARANVADVVVTIAGVRVPVLYAGPQSQFVGLDQVNVAIPDTLRGQGTVEIRIAIGSATSNAVIIAVQ
jgi:uncharacterized protein (TIGR03437 family)